MALRIAQTRCVGSLKAFQIVITAPLSIESREGEIHDSFYFIVDDYRAGCSTE